MGETQYIVTGALLIAGAVLLVVFASHYVASLVAEEATGLQFLLTLLLTLGVGETVGWHTGVFLRWREERARAGAAPRAKEAAG